MAGATFFKGDCLEQMKRLRDKSITLILWNPPFGTTQQPWDERLPWEAIFKECFRILDDAGTLVIHASVPFNYTLIRAAPRPPTYSWYWKKESPTNPFLANYQPLRCVEEILVWRNQKTTYYPQNVGEEITTRTYPRNNAEGYYLHSKGGLKVKKGKSRTHFIEMKRRLDGFSTRPDEMIELMIKSYTKEGDTMLDPTCYKGVSGVIAKRLGRKWIGFDKYFMPSLLLCDAAP